MAVTLKNYNSAAGITYKYITDTQADWGNVPVDQYFFDLETVLPYYRDSQGYVIEVFATGQSTGNVTTFANIDKQLISGGAQWNTGMTFEISTLTYSFDGTIQTTDGPSTVTLSVGNISFDRIDAIVVNDDTPNGTVSVIEGQPAANPATPEIPFDKLLVQYIIVGAGVTSIAVNQDIIYNENTEWTGSIVDVSGLGTLNFASTTPTPQQGTKCLRVTGNDRRKWARFTRTSPLTASDYTSISGYFYAEDYAPNRRLYIRFRSGTSYVGNWVYVTNTFASTSTPGIWQQFTVPLYLFNLPSQIDGIDIRYTANFSAATAINNWALDFVRLQGGFNPAQITSNNSNIYVSNGSLTADRTVDLGSYDLLFSGNANSKINHKIGTRELNIDTNGININQAYTLPNTDGTSGQVITTNGSGVLSFTTPTGGGITGTGTTNYVPRWASSSSLSSTSLIYDNNTFVGINIVTQSIDEKLRVSGGVRVDDGTSILLLRNGDFTFQNDVSSTDFNIISNGGGVAIAFLNIIGGTSGWGRITYGKAASSQKLEMYNNLTSASVITLTPANDVGIGIGTPSGKLHVVASSNNSPVLVLNGLNDTSIVGENLSITKQADTATTGTGTSIAATITLGSGKRLVCNGRFIAIGGSTTVGGDFMVVAENIAGTINIVGSDVSLKENSSGTPVVDFDGVLGTVRLKATGGGESLSWLFTYTYEIISGVSG